jgi:hypothetical protein
MISSFPSYSNEPAGGSSLLLLLFRQNFLLINLVEIISDAEPEPQEALCWRRNGKTNGLTG